MSQAQISRLPSGCRVAIVGRLSSMTRREAQKLITALGGMLTDKSGASADWIVVGDETPRFQRSPSSFPVSWQTALRQGASQLLAESELWQRLGLIEASPHVQRLYTPAMLADLVGVPLAAVRRWHRRGLLQQAAQVHHLAYFDFAEVAAARRLAEWNAQGLTTSAIEKQLERIARLTPEIERPLTELSLAFDGRQLLIRQGDDLIESGGQRRLDFEPADTAQPALNLDSFTQSPDELCALAAELDETGHLVEAADMYRAALATGGPDAEICFALAELLYRLRDLSAAAERYYMVLELDEEHVEARANLGCVLAELGRHELALAAFEGTLASHSDYSDVHYHLARLLDELDRRDEAQQHWQAFIDLAPASPWADAARQRLTLSS